MSGIINSVAKNLGSNVQLLKGRSRMCKLRYKKEHCKDLLCRGGGGGGGDFVVLSSFIYLILQIFPSDHTSFHRAAHDRHQYSNLIFDRVTHKR